MTDPIVVIESPSVQVSADTGTPVTTITDNLTGSVTIVAAAPTVTTLMDERPTVSVYTGSGPAIVINGDKGDTGLMGPVGDTGPTGVIGPPGLKGDTGLPGNDASLLLPELKEVLTGEITIDLMAAGLYADLSQLNTLWVRIGADALLTYPEGVALQEAGRLITNQSITDAVNDLSVTVDGQIDLNTSLIEQTALGITQLVTDLRQETDGTFTIHDSRITQTASEIASTVLALASTDAGIVAIQSDITQNADRITLGVIRQDNTDGDIITLGSRITLTEDTIDLAVIAFDAVADRVTSAEITIAENTVTLSVSSQYLSQKIETIQTILDNQWGVTVEEDINGNSYVAGFNLLLHPAWALGGGYAIGDTVYFLDGGVEEAYVCILENVGDITNSPTNATYWTVIPGGAKSVFTVSAEKFQVTGPNGIPEPLFVVDAVTDEVTINGALIVSLIKSTGWDSGVGAGFLLDPDSGIAEFRDIKMVFTTSDTKDDAKTALGISDELVFSWDGNEGIRTESSFDGAQEWTFDSAFYAGGAMIQIEIDDAFVGDLSTTLNAESLYLDAFGDHDFGEYEVSSAFSNESSLDACIDLTVTGDDADLGGF